MANVLGFFKKVMPFLTTGLSLVGPPGILAAGILGKVFKMDSPTANSIQDTLSKLSLTPELQVQLQEAENDYKKQMQAMGYQHEEELAQLGVADKASARSMQVATKSWTAPALAWAIVVSFGATVTLVLMGRAKVDAAFAGALIGYLANNSTQVVSYYFGSSAGSDRKTELMANGAIGGTK